MRRITMLAAAVATMVATPAMAGDKSSGRKAQERGTAEMPHCVKPLGTIAIVEPDKQWWVDYQLGSPERY